jgi:cob(I)alamin adenosyltransferase
MESGTGPLGPAGVYRVESDKQKEAPFSQPRLAINRVYTRGGDKGQTALVGGQRIAKDDIRIEAFGTVDELNSFVGLARQSVSELAARAPGLAPLGAILRRVQHELFNAGSILATLPEDVHPRQARITAAEPAQLEREIDQMNEVLTPLRSFVLPGGCRLNAELHVCRTVCRRAERVCVTLAADPDVIRYLNRLSDALFVWSRWASLQLGAAETLWEPNQAASTALYSENSTPE